MSTTTLHVVLRRLRAAAVHDETDAQLVQRFVAQRDEAAFAILVRRHGPMVLSVCGRVLGSMHDAEDAFQATFLVLARKAATIRKMESLSSWLHGVAFHLASKLRARDTVRRRHETKAGEERTREAGVETAWRELQELLDSELQRLPAKYRMPLVLCYLEDRTHDEAARQLGWPVGTVKSRLAKGREELRTRLEGRGLTLSASAFAVALAANTAAAALPATVNASAIRAAIAISAGQPARGIVSSAALALADGMLRTTAALIAKLAALVLLALGIGAAIGYRPSALNEQPEEPTTQRADELKAESPKPKTDRHGDPLPPGAVARLGTTRFRTDTFGHLAAFLLDGNKLISVAGEYKNMSICIWDAQSGKVLRRFAGKQWNRECAALSPDQKRLATADYEGSITLWDVAAGKEFRRIKAGTNSLYSLAFSPDSRKLAASGPSEPVRIMDVDDGRELLQLKGKAEDASRVAFSPDGKLLASSGRTGVVCLWDAATGRLVHEWETGHTRQTHALAFAPDGKTVASAGGDDKNIQLHDVATGKKIRSLVGDAQTHCLVFAPDSNTLAAGGWSGFRCGIRLWDLKTGKELPGLKGHFFGVESLAYSADGKRLVSAGVDNAIRLWDSATGKELSPNADHFGWLTAVVFLPDGRTLATGGMDGTIRFWDATEGKQLRQFEGHTDRVWHLLLSADGKMLASASEDATARLWDLATGKELRRFKDHQRGIVSMALSADGRLLATGERDGSLHIWDARTGAEVQQIVAPAVRPLGALTFSPDSKLLAGVILNLRGLESVLTLWDVATGKEVRHWAIPSDSGYIVFSPDGRSLAVTREGPVPLSVYEISTGKQQIRIMNHWHTMASAPIFSPDGRMLVTTARQDRAIRLWEIASGKVRRQFAGHQGTLMSVAYSPDGRLLASGSMDTTALVWEVQPSGHALAAKDLDAAWEQLGDTDAAMAYRAISNLTASPAQAVSFIKKHVAPVPALDAKVVEQFIADLDSDQFAARRVAAKELQKLGELAESILRKGLEEQPSAETRRSVELLLDKLNSTALSGEALRGVRAVEVLEHIATPEAQQVLEKLAGGAPDARLTREAKASLQRLQQRHPAP
jgi:RNA polymerase sigma factor (sigma-70 family)